MKRLVLALIVLATTTASASAAEKTYRLGILEPSAASAAITRDYFFPELAKLGFRQGANLVIEERIGGGPEMPRLAQEVLSSKPHAIMTMGGDAARAVRKATSTVPIVMFGTDPVRRGWAASFARPGGNLTGVVLMTVELDAKRLSLLHDAAPMARRVAALVGRSTGGRESESAMRAVAASTGIELLVYQADGPDDYPGAFAAMQTAGAQALAITATAYFYRDAAQLAQLALEAGLPTICEFAETARSGCLIGYGADRSELRRRMAYQVARIFRGALLGDLPIEQPTHYQLAVNLKTAKTLGLEIAQSILARADEVIE